MHFPAWYTVNNESIKSGFTSFDGKVNVVLASKICACFKHCSINGFTAFSSFFTLIALITIINLIQLYGEEYNKLQGKIMIYHCHVTQIWD